MSLQDAISKAKNLKLDLVEVAPDSNPPVCKIMDYGKHKYKQTKQKQTKKQTVTQVKEIKFRPSTEQNDLNTKKNHIRKFLSKKHRVKVTVMFKGREIILSTKGKEMLDKILLDFEDVANIYEEPKFEGRTIHAILSPK